MTLADLDCGARQGLVYNCSRPAALRNYERLGHINSFGLRVSGSQMAGLGGMITRFGRLRKFSHLNCFARSELKQSQFNSIKAALNF